MDAPEMPRNKPRRIWLSVVYRLSRRVAPLVGRKRFLGWALDLNWAMRRIAWEQAGYVYEERFHNSAMGLDEDLFATVLAGRDSVLDVGCGYGRWSRIAAKHATQVVGIDRDRRSIDAARAASDAPNVTFTVADVVADLDGRFDLALLIHVLEHIDQPVELLMSLGRVATSLVVEVPDFEADALNVPRTWLGRPFYSDSDHVREYTDIALKEHLEKAGWTIDGIHRRAGTLVAVASGKSSISDSPLTPEV